LSLATAGIAAGLICDTIFSYRYNNHIPQAKLTALTLPPPAATAAWRWVRIAWWMWQTADSMRGTGLCAGAMVAQMCRAARASGELARAAGGGAAAATGATTRNAKLSRPTLCAVRTVRVRRWSSWREDTMGRSDDGRRRAGVTAAKAKRSTPTLYAVRTVCVRRWSSRRDDAVVFVRRWARARLGDGGKCEAVDANPICREDSACPALERPARRCRGVCPTLGEGSA